MSAWRATRTNGGTFASVEEAELDSGRIDREAHLAAERVDLADEMALADAADRGIAGHLADMIEVEREHQRARAHPSGSERGFDTGMAGANHDDVVGHQTAIMTREARAQRGADTLHRRKVGK